MWPGSCHIRSRFSSFFSPKRHATVKVPHTRNALGEIEKISRNSTQYILTIGSKKMPIDSTAISNTSVGIFTDMPLLPIGSLLTNFHSVPLQYATLSFMILWKPPQTRKRHPLTGRHSEILLFE